MEYINECIDKLVSSQKKDVFDFVNILKKCVRWGSLEYECYSNDENAENVFIETMIHFVDFYRLKYKNLYKEVNEVPQDDKGIIEELESNPFYMETTKIEYSRKINSLEFRIKKYKHALATMEAFTHERPKVTEIKMKEGEEIKFTLQKRLTLKSKNYLIGLNKGGNQIALCYSDLWYKLDPTPDKSYYIKHTGEKKLKGYKYKMFVFQLEEATEFNVAKRKSLGLYH
jgi:hypothetical protein